MKKIFLLAIFASSVLSLISQSENANRKGLPQARFEENKGQWHSNVKYRVELINGHIFYEKEGFTVSFDNASASYEENHHTKDAAGHSNEGLKVDGVKAKYLNSNANVLFETEGKSEYFRNYFIGSDRSKWASNVHLFDNMIMKNLYQNIDVKYKSTAENIKYDVIVHPGGNPYKYKVAYEGHKSLSVDEEGNLIMTSRLGQIKELKPIAYQIINGNKVDVKVNFVINENVASFDFPEAFDANYDLVIDPFLVASTLTGSTADNWGFTACPGPGGQMRVGGIAFNTGYPVTAGAFDNSFNGAADISISFFSANGSTLQASTYLGGAGNDYPHSIITSTNGDLYIVGRTESNNFPTSVGCLDNTFNGGTTDMVVCRLNAGLTNLIASTYVGGSGFDATNVDNSFTGTAQIKFSYADTHRSQLRIDNAGNVVIASNTQSANWPTTAGCFDNALSGTQDGVVLKLNNTLTTLIFSTYIGGAGYDACQSIQIDAANTLYVAGTTNSNNFPTTAGVIHPATLGGVDGFVFRMNSTGTILQTSTYLGTANKDGAFNVDLDNANNVHVYGLSDGGAYPVTAGTYSNTNSCQFVHGLNNNLTATIYSTVFGNGITPNLSPTAFEVDSCSNIYACGWGRNFDGGNNNGMATTPGAFQTTTDGRDFYFITLTPNATSLLYASYFGQNGGTADHVDGGTSIFSNSGGDQGVVYQAVCSTCGASTTGFPTTPGAYSANDPGPNCNNAVFKFDLETYKPSAAAVTSGGSGCVGAPVTFTNNSTNAISFIWNFGDGSPVSTATNPVHTYTAAGVYTGTLQASNLTTCISTVQTQFTVTVGNNPTVTIVVSSGSNPSCSGTVAILQASGAANYTWSPLGLNTSTVSVSPTVATVYTVVGTSTLGCPGNSTFTLNVAPNPTITASASPTAACSGASSTLSAIGASTYTWNPGGAIGATVTSPTISANTIFTVVGTTTAGCVGTRTVQVALNNCPTAVNDATNTVINTSVVANAGTNDLGVAGGTFAITGQPTNGTVAINPSTGQYTFTPTTGFTGITTSTYQLCNGAPVVCSNATITFTVYPNIIANTNTISTAINTPTTGNLATNDIIPAGVGINVSVTQPAATTGTIVVNSTTGQYTFTPNPAFSGTASTTYTVCNTTVNPSQCTATTIIIQVGTPIAVSNTNTTMQNTPVSGNAGANDAGTNATLNPAWTTGQPTAGTGTIVMNPATGQYTFTPATGFTGTTVATYTLCNLLSPPCSTTTITFTVFPTLTAVSNTITTTPSVTTTGTLTTNDPGFTTGLTLGATFSVSVTQPAPTTGTININPSTGQYTFIPNPAFTGTAQTTYTVCNTAVTPTVCSNTTILIQVGNLPSAISNTNTTMQNTPVSGNAGANDGGTNATLNPAWTTGQPTAGTGTIVMNPATGQYTFTPATGFTGTTVATYTLCNLLSPPCSTTTITFTVFPTLVANQNTISTTPSVTTTGNLLSDDGGIVVGGVYTVSVTQPSPTAGTITINPSTGQYTFIPNPAFTGTVQTTYTVCNISVTPSVCSSTTIFIQVGNTALAIADFTTTVINTPVSGTVSTNDGGTNAALNPAWTTGQPTAGTGTIVMNPATGQYTFTPATGFTGTTVATYTLCNLLSPPCSTTTITFTVFPNVVAVSNTINTTPSVTATGSLTANDIGIIAGANYSVTVTQPSPTTGTITINPATGQYTFVPNPSFTGSVNTTYTICNVTVNPTQCSNTTITIIVGNTPLAVNDATNTLINNPVSGDASINDSGTATGTFVIVSQPTNGTVTINPATGQYTFVPTTGFTGTTIATYQLCNVLSPPCVTANITFTVFPAIVTNSDVISTTPSVTTTGNILSNDILPVGATFSVTVSQPSPTTGTIVINPATGQYTFIPNPSFTGSTTTTTYTVCNTSITPQNCSTNTILIVVGNLPLAVNDATITLINTAVSGNAGTNDSGAGLSLNPVFTTGQPTAGTGTLVMNPTTGQYTYTPATGFTGTTQATYTLCNLASPPCSTASITFTVYPTLIAVNDPIATTPSVTTTGTLTGNDIGLLPGGTYTTLATPFNPTTGTITVNPATGQYTFVPNPSFTGTAQTTYTICQYVPPSTVALQCSTATITVNVSNLPVALNDATVTLINTSVSGNAGLNDSGTSGGTFTNGQPTAGTGTLTMNPTTGQYTFTPATGFTGTTIATYTLCNLFSPPCSTASITFTVYPSLTAVNDPIATTPSVTTTGTLTGNDVGLVPGGTYTTVATPFNPTTGTITVNPATGQYTFVPNPSFTGTAQTTYTICQYVPPSTFALQCSTATITVNVSNLPVAVNDATVTLINTSVSGNAGLNDSGTSGGTFTNGQPTAGTGTLVMNPTTGQYTYTPATGFTGTTQATYTLCNLFSPPCSTASITFTVYPTLIAVNDPIATTPSVTTTGTLTGNDIGLVPGGTYTTVATPFNPTTGTITVNPATGQYTFVPNPSFTGTAQTTYTICQYVPPSTVALQCSTATITIVVGNIPLVGTAKSVSTPTYNTDGTISLMYRIAVKNYGTLALTNVSVADNLSNTFPSPATYTITNAPIVTTTIGTQLVIDNVYTGAGSNTVMTLPLTSSLAVGRTDTLTFGVKVSLNGFTGSFNNFAIVSATSGTVSVVDTSSNGNDPDPNNNGNPTDDDGPTIFTPMIVKIGVAKMSGKVESDGAGCNAVAFKFTIKNYGASTAYNVSLIDNLDNTFINPSTYTVLSAPISINGILSTNALFSGNGNNTNLLTPTNSLAVNAVDTIIVKVRFCSNGGATSYSNIAVVSANSSSTGLGAIGTDVSTNGLDPDPSGNNNPSDNGEDIPTVFTGSDIDVVVPEGFNPNDVNGNQTWIIKGIENYPENVVSVYNRWGNLVYQKEGYSNTDAWNGNANSNLPKFGSNRLPQGTYYYVIEFRGSDLKPMKGFVVLKY